MVSILIPVYNAEKYLEQCIDSILNQTYGNLEIVILNDGSTDSSLSICEEYSKKDNRIKVYSQENKGIAETRNILLSLAKGEYIMFVDADDYIAADTCEKCLKTLENDCSDMVIFGYNLVSVNGEDISVNKELLREQISGYELCKRILSSEIRDYLCTKFFKRQLFENITFPSGHRWEDLATAYRIALNANNVSIIEEAFYFYRQHSNSITNSINSKAIENIFLVRYNRHNYLLREYEDLSSYDIPYLALSATNLYDRSLKTDVDKELLKKAMDFLAFLKNSQYNCPFKKVNFYLKSRSIYTIFIKLKQFLGKIYYLFKR